MKNKTTELIGPALDWAVGDIEFKRLLTQGSHVKQWVLDDHRKGTRTDPWSTDWLFGGPIIEREGIGTSKRYAPKFLPKGVPPVIDWSASYFEPPHSALMVHRHFGPTPLIAAMRCYVASKLGEEIDVPEELL